MKKIILIINLVITTISVAQNSDSFIGTWESIDNNQIFRVELFREFYTKRDNTQGSVIAGNFSKIEVDANGNETILVTSDRLFNSNDPNDTRKFPAPIRGGVYNDQLDNFRFLIEDFTSPDIPMVTLHLSFIEGTNNAIGVTPQIKWKISSAFFGQSSVNFPFYTILTRVN